MTEAAEVARKSLNGMFRHPVVCVIRESADKRNDRAAMVRPMRQYRRGLALRGLLGGLGLNLTLPNLMPTSLQKRGGLISPKVPARWHLEGASDRHRFGYRRAHGLTDGDRAMARALCRLMVRLEPSSTCNTLSTFDQKFYRIEF
jgi:hypothetical protein